MVWLAVGVALGAAFRRTLPAISPRSSHTGPPTSWSSGCTRPHDAPDGPDPPRGRQGSAAQFGANSLAVENPSGTIYDSGHPVSPALQSLGLRNNLPNDQVNPCLAPQRHLMTLLRYQPGSRIPDFHLILIGGYLGLGAVAA